MWRVPSSSGRMLSMPATGKDLEMESLGISVSWYLSWGITRQLRLQLRTRRKRTIDDGHRLAQLLAGELQSWRPDTVASHPDPLLRELDQLHELHYRIHAQQWQKPLVERECFRLSSFSRIPVKSYRFGRERVNEPRDPANRPRIDGFDDGVVDAHQNLHARARQRADRHHSPKVGARFLDCVQVGKLARELEDVKRQEIGLVRKRIVVEHAGKIGGGDHRADVRFHFAPIAAVDIRRQYHQS